MSAASQWDGPAGDYRVYWLADDGAISSADWIQATSDREALEKVETMALSAAWELWLLDRRVSVMKP